jgi:hypothetical protein
MLLGFHWDFFSWGTITKENYGDQEAERDPTFYSPVVPVHLLCLSMSDKEFCPCALHSLGFW